MGDASPVFEGAGCKRSRDLDGSVLGCGNHAKLTLKTAKRKVIAWNPSGGIPVEKAVRVELVEAVSKEPADFDGQHTVESDVMSTTNSCTRPPSVSLNSPVHGQQPSEVEGGSQQPPGDDEEDESEGWHEGDVGDNGALEGFNKCYVPGHGTYEGSFHDGRPHGTGKLEKEDGTILDGTFDCGVFVSGTMSKGDSGQFLDTQVVGNAVSTTPIEQYTHEFKGPREQTLKKTPVAPEKREAAELQPEQTAVEKAAAAAQAAKRRSEQEAAELQRKQTATEKAAASAQAAKRRSEEEAAELQRKQTAIEKQAAVQHAKTSFMYHIGATRSTPCRIRRRPTTTSDHVGMMYGATVPVTNVEGIWAKLHVDAMALARGSYGFSPFDIRTEGWIMLTTANGVAIWEPAAGPMRGDVKVRLMD